MLGYAGKQDARDKNGFVRRTGSMKEKSTAVFEPENAIQLAHFFKANKSKYHEIWIVLTKKEIADPQPVSFLEALSEAKKHGLIDSRTKTVSDQKYMIRFTKRKPKLRKASDQPNS